MLTYKPQSIVLTDMQREFIVTLNRLENECPHTVRPHSKSGKVPVVLQLAKRVRVNPAEFVVTLNELSQRGFVQMRGKSAEVLGKEARRSLGVAFKKGSDEIEGWVQALGRLAARERNKPAKALKVATAPVFLTKQGYNLLRHIRL